uniref:BY PROTMAP: gi/472583835/gb/EMS21459.1/ protein of Emopamil-binding protein family [Rhodosporidium toruloides NP11] gi/647402252/emb/CDR48534.1/ RHTO0S18e02168g1_1 [Rhodosporidium toruloides] n=1 Tax=Rhodotorula toruloides TaxID=5286 RepID=A0A0K3CCY7_RHOTO
MTVHHAPPPTLLTQTTLLSLASTVALLALAVALARRLLPARRYADAAQRFTFVWLAFDALVHFTLEASFVVHSFPRPRTVNSGIGPFAALWREYALADTRWGTSDPTVVSIELITVFGAGPLAAYCANGMRRSKNETWRLWIVAELYGGWMTFAPEWITGSPSLNTSHPLYTWVYLAFFNGLWVVIPLWLIWDSGRVILRALTTAEEAKAK